MSARLRSPIVVLVLACGSLLGAAPPARGADVFLGYSVLRREGSTVGGGVLALAWPADRRLRLAVEAGAHSGLSGGDDLREVSLAAGPLLSARADRRLRPFLSAKAGVVSVRRQVEVFGVSIGSLGVCDGACPSQTGLLVEAGGGLDLALTRRFALRVPQADYRVTRVSGQTSRALRVSAGLVYRR